MASPPRVLRTLADRFDPEPFDAPGGRAVLRLRVEGEGDWDALVDGGELKLVPAGDGRPDARLFADAATWRKVADDLSGGMDAFRRGRLKLRDDLHLGVGFLAATSGSTAPGRLEVGRVETAITTSQCCGRARAIRSCSCTASAPPRPRSCPRWPRWQASSACLRSTCPGSATP